MTPLVVIVGHHSRYEWIDRILEVLPDAIAVVDPGDNGAIHNHIRVLSMIARSDRRCIIMEDDAIPVVGFMERAEQWCVEYPDDLISFYLGTGRPPQWQARVDAELGAGTAHIHLPALLHGVCYSIPPNEIPRVLATMRKDGAADSAIGRAWGRNVLYPVESLVEHRDGTPVERHPDGMARTEPRVARRLAGPLLFDR